MYNYNRIITESKKDLTLWGYRKTHCGVPKDGETVWYPRMHCGLPTWKI